MANTTKTIDAQKNDRLARRALSRITASTPWRSVFRNGLILTNRDRALAAYGNFFLHLHPVKVRKSTLRFCATFCLGGLSLALFISLTLTGVLLMFYYHPSAPRAYEDMKDLEFVVSSGVFLRNLHRWSAHLMVIGVFLHMLRVYFSAAYRPPREFNWVVGVLLLILTLLLSFTGYLLPWDQLAYWATTVGTNMAGAVPILGEKIRFLLLGGNVIGENTLIRFYVLHCVVLPIAIVVLMGVHFWRVRKDGGLARPL